MRTAIRNIEYLKTFAESILIENKISYTGDDLGIIIKKWGTPKEIDRYFDIFTMAFGDWLISLNERTKEHSMGELLKEYREMISKARDEQQVDYIPFQEDEITHAPGSCPL